MIAQFSRTATLVVNVLFSGFGIGWGLYLLSYSTNFAGDSEAFSEAYRSFLGMGLLFTLLGVIQLVRAIFKFRAAPAAESQAADSHTGLSFDPDSLIKRYAAAKSVEPTFDPDVVINRYMASKSAKPARTATGASERSAPSTTPAFGRKRA